MSTGRSRCGGGAGATAARMALAPAQVIPFTDAAPMMLAPPAGATLAEISTEGGAVRWTTSGTAPDNGTFYGHRTTDWGRIELESSSEIANFQLIGLPGQSGTIYVEYFSLPADENM